jgi:hypothetical protein
MAHNAVMAITISGFNPLNIALPVRAASNCNICLPKKLMPKINACQIYINTTRLNHLPARTMALYFPASVRIVRCHAPT